MSSTEGGPGQQSGDEYCGYCGSRIPPLGRYCPNCGSLRMSLRAPGAPPGTGVAWQSWTWQPPAPARRGKSLRLTVKTILAFGMLIFIAQLMLSLAALIYGTSIVIPEILSASFTLPLIAFKLIELVTISGAALGVYYILVVAAISVSAAWLFLSSWRLYLKELKTKAESRKHSTLFDVCGLMFGTLFLQWVVVLIVMIVWGDDLADPVQGLDLWELLFLLANASVWEELVSRVLLIGVPLLVIDLARRGLKPKKSAYILGGGFDLGMAEVVLLLVSSTMFGYAHYDGGWGAWKIFPSSVAGLAFGYLFLRHGLAAAIMLHFAIDYLSMPLEVFVGDSGGWAYGLYAASILLWLGMGAVFFVYYVTRMFEFVTNKKYFEEKPQVGPAYPGYYTYRYVPPEPALQTQSPTAQGWQGDGGPAVSPAPPGLGAGFFVCPVCGNTSARWMEGKFQCLRCGAVI